MSTGEMLAWTNRLKDVRNIKNSALKRDRMQNLRRDFLESHGWIEGLKKLNNPYLNWMYSTIEHEYILIV